MGLIYGLGDRLDAKQTCPLHDHVDEKTRVRVVASVSLNLFGGRQSSEGHQARMRGTILRISSVGAWRRVDRGNLQESLEPHPDGF